MRKFQWFGIAVVAVLLFGVAVASSASAAVTFLLAEWLVNGKPVIEGESFTVRSTGSLLLEDLKTLLGASSVECTGILLGWIGPDGLDLISEVLNAEEDPISSTPLSGTPLICKTEKTCEEALVWPLHLGWETLVELWEVGGLNGFIDLILPDGNGNPGWYVLCEKTITKPVDECSAASAGVELGLSGGTLTGGFSEAFTVLMEESLAECTQSKEKSGVVESIPVGSPGLITSPGKTLSASSEETGGTLEA
ncbi:MAG: hypothetical protein WBV77_03420 [Solirubrobacteraceae bacterium]